MRKTERRDAAQQEVLSATREQFTAVRDRVARELARSGDDEGARAVKALRRPTLPVWAVNQLARDAPGEIDQLVSTTAELRTAQASAAAGGDAAAVRAAATRQRELLRTLRARAAALLGKDPSSGAAVLDRVEATLLGAASGAREDVEALRHGRLETERSAPGFDALLGLAPAAPRRKAARRAEQEAAKAEAAARAATEALEAAEHRRVELRNRLEALAAELADTRRALASAQAEVQRQKSALAAAAAKARRLGDHARSRR